MVTNTHTRATYLWCVRACVNLYICTHVNLPCEQKTVQSVIKDLISLIIVNKQDGARLLKHIIFSVGKPTHNRIQV